MMKYLCLIVLICQIYGAPVDDTDRTGKHVVEDVEVHNTSADDHVPDVGLKKLSTKPPKVVEILESGSEHQTDGSYSFHYRGADGTFREETAVVKNAGTDHEYLEISGAYSFFDTDGKEVVVQYKADDRGFVPVGNNIPDIISLAARENSQLPAIKKDSKNYDDVEDSEVVVKKTEKTK